MSILKDSISITCPPTSDDIVVDQLRVLHKPVKLSLFDTKMRPFSCSRILLDNTLCYTVGNITYGYRHWADKSIRTCDSYEDTTCGGVAHHCEHPYCLPEIFVIDQLFLYGSDTRPYMKSKASVWKGLIGLVGAPMPGQQRYDSLLRTSGR